MSFDRNRRVVCRYRVEIRVREQHRIVKSVIDRDILCALVFFDVLNLFAACIDCPVYTLIVKGESALFGERKVRIRGVNNSPYSYQVIGAFQFRDRNLGE